MTDKGYHSNDVLNVILKEGAGERGAGPKVFLLADMMNAPEKVVIVGKNVPGERTG